MAAARSVWKGFIQFSLVSVPVKAFTAAASGGGKVQLNQLHAECHSRVKYTKSCPVHGEVPADQIVSGYEFADGKYVVIDTDELDKLRSPSERAVTIRSFLDRSDVPDRYLCGRTLYLVPDGLVGQKPYNLLHRVMTETGRAGFAQVVMGGKEKLMLIRPVDSLLAMSELSFESELHKPSEFSDQVTKVEIPASVIGIDSTCPSTNSTLARPRCRSRSRLCLPKSVVWICRLKSASVSSGPKSKTISQSSASLRGLPSIASITADALFTLVSFPTGVSVSDAGAPR